MKKWLAVLISFLLMTTTISSQTIPQDTVIPITATQLKTANLIFAEHDKLKQELPLLESKITNLETINSNWERMDSLRLSQISMYKDIVIEKDKNIEQLSKSAKRNRRWAIGTGITSVILALLCILK